MKVISDSYEGGREERWTKNGKLHRTDGPALLEYHKSGFLWLKAYYHNGLSHKKVGPATITYKANGKLSSEEYYIDGGLHREDGPATIEYFDHGDGIEWEAWYVNGSMHREDGPAELEYDIKGNVVQTIWALNGEMLNFNDWLKKMDMTVEEKVALKLLYT